MKSAEAFRENMRRRRRELGWTQTDLALKMQCSQPYVAGIEAGRSIPTLDVVDRVAGALKCQSATLLMPVMNPEPV